MRHNKGRQKYIDMGDNKAGQTGDVTANNRTTPVKTDSGQFSEMVNEEDMG